MMTTARGGGPAVTVGARGRDVVSRAPRAMRGARTSVGGSFAPSGGRARVGGSLAVGGNGANRGRRVIQSAEASSASGKGKREKKKSERERGKGGKSLMKKALRLEAVSSPVEVELEQSEAADAEASARASSAGMEPKPMIAPRVSKHEKSGKYESGANGQSEGRASSRLTRPKFADERTFTRRRKFPVLFYSKEMEPLARKVADASDQMVELGQIDWRTFPDGFPDLFINDAYDVRDRHVAFLGSFHSPEVIFEQLSIIYSLPKMFVASFTLVLPFFPTGTAERVVREGEVATAVTLARILSNIPPSRGGPTSTIIFDIHALQERFYFGDSILPCFESGIPLLIERLNTLEDADNVVIAYPDEGAYKRFHSFFSGYECIVCTKVREGTKRIVKLKEGEPIGRHVVIVDDLVQSGSTLIECQKLLHRLGAAKVSAYATHGVFPNDSWKRFTSTGAGGQGFTNFWITDSCPQTVEVVEGVEPFEILSLAVAIAEALEV
tara:strand:+ start:332 stop:1822 length:1491 start_codon:yes stop_codon:yes gene_type:complete